MIRHPHVCFVDKLAARIPRLAPGILEILKANAKSADLRPGKPIPYSDKKWLLTVVTPNDAALKVLEKIPELMLNACELACDIEVPDKFTAFGIAQYFEGHFVQGRRGTGRPLVEENGMYTRASNRGRRYAWYWDWASKITRQACFHLEARVQGVAALRPLGIRTIADLIDFDHQAFWTKYLRLYEIDYERLGRYQANKVLKQRRQKPLLTSSGGYTYNHDRSNGCATFRWYAITPAGELYCAKQDIRPDARLITRSVQAFVENFGRGPFLVPIDLDAVLLKIMAAQNGE